MRLGRDDDRLHIRNLADERERGPVRVRDALKYSMNIPIAKAQQLIGTSNGRILRRSSTG